MAKKIKISRKQIKQPDEFITWSERVIEWAEENVWLVTGAVALVIVVFLLGQGAAYWLSGRSDAPKRALAEAVEISNQPVSADEQVFPADLGGERFSSEKEKHDAAARVFAEVAREYKGTVEGGMATLYLARSRERAGDHDRAIENYNEFLKTPLAQKQEALKHSAYMGLARTRHLKGEYQEAQQYFDKVIEADSPYKADALLEGARNLEALDRHEEARAMLDKLSEDYPKSYLSLNASFLPDYWEQKREQVKKEAELELIKDMGVDLGAGSEPGTEEDISIEDVAPESVLPEGE